MAKRFSIAVVDDHPLFRGGVVRALELDPALSVIGEGSSAADALALARKLRPNVMLLDISMPGDSINAVQQIGALNYGIRTVMLTVSESIDHLVLALEAGAAGYILKRVGAGELISAVKAVADGENYFTPVLAAGLITHVRPRPEDVSLQSLTTQQQRILRLVAEGQSNREIGLALSIDEKTVKFHMTRIMDKLAVKNRVAAARIAAKAWNLP